MIPNLSPVSANALHRSAWRRPVRVILVVTLSIATVVAIGAFYVLVVFAPHPEDGYRLVSATCAVDDADPDSAALSLVLEPLPGSLEPFVLYADVADDEGVRQVGRAAVDDEGAEQTLTVVLRRAATAGVARASQIRVGWSPGEPGYYQVLQLGLVWDESGCTLSDL